MTDYKIIQDPLNGPIKLSGLYEELLDTHEMQRLRYVRSLGLCYLVFPGANHSRFEHSLGVMSLAREFAMNLNLGEPDLASVAGLLHDVGHPPLSHGVEGFFHRTTGLNHLEAGIQIVRGTGKFGESSIPAVLEKHGIDPAGVAEIMSGKSSSYPVHSKIVSGPIDVDEMDYLRRDSLFCGVRLGLIDEKRIMNIAKVDYPDLVIEEKGVPAVESVLIARILMYNSVYFHKTCRIAQHMAEKSLELYGGNIENPFSMSDHELMSTLTDDRTSSDIASAILDRKLYKPVIKIPYRRDTAEEISSELAKRFEGYDYIVDVIPPLEFSGIDRVKSDLKVVTGSETFQLEQVSPLVRALYDTLENRIIAVSVRHELLEEAGKVLSRFRSRQ